MNRWMLRRADRIEFIDATTVASRDWWRRVRRACRRCSGFIARRPSYERFALDANVSDGVHVAPAPDEKH
jgi:hypothetical protein